MNELLFDKLNTATIKQLISLNIFIFLLYDFTSFVTNHSSVALIENNLQRAEAALCMDSPNCHYWNCPSIHLL